MIVLFTDFGVGGPYTGQVKAVLHRYAPSVPVVDLFVDAPSRDPQAAAYLLAAYATAFAPGTVLLCIVDPGVGSDRPACVVRADGRWFVGPGNGVFELVLRRAQGDAGCWRIDWRPEALSATFHGRDLFAPVAARLACAVPQPLALLSGDAGRHPDWPDDLARIVYVDHYGNAMTGVRAAVVPDAAVVVAGGVRLRRAATFAEMPPARAFWYGNANGLLEIAVNMGSAAEVLGIGIGTPVYIESHTAQLSSLR